MKNSVLKKNQKYTEQIKELLRRISFAQEQGTIETKGSLNLFDINSISHLENYHTNIIASLLDGKQKHRHPEFGELFIQTINDRYPESPLPPHVGPITVVREKSINSGRIDIFIETNSFVLIIENKIYASDDTNQLQKYYEWGLETFLPKNKKVILCYLTLDGELPVTNSLEEDTRKELASQGQYYSISYSRDILSWLESLQVREGEEVLQAALAQYIDVVQGLCGEREVDVMELTWMIKNMEEMCASASKIELNQIQKNIELIQQSCHYYLFIQFLIEVVENLSSTVGTEKKIQRSIFFTHHQRRFSMGDRADWESSIVQDFKNIGIEIPFDEYAGIGIELDNIAVNNITVKPQLTYGIMSHGKTEETAYCLEEAWNGGGFTIKKGDNTWWKEYVTVNYVLKNLFDTSDSKLDIGTLAAQATGWIIDTWHHNHKILVP